MDETIKSTSVTFEKSSYSFELLKHHLSGENYVSIQQHTKNNSALSVINISSKNCLELLNHLHHFLYEEPLPKEPKPKNFTFETNQLIISNFLKGVSIKDLCLTYNYKENDVVNILKSNNIEIIDGIKMPKPRFYFKKKKR